MMTDIFNGIGNACQWFFKFMPGFGNGPNLFFWLIIAFLLVTWLRMQGRYNKQAKNDPNQLK